MDSLLSSAASTVSSDSLSGICYVQVDAWNATQHVTDNGSGTQTGLQFTLANSDGTQESYDGAYTDVRGSQSPSPKARITDSNQ